MSDDRHAITARNVVALRAEDATPAYSSAPQPAAVPAAARPQTPLEQMFAYYEAA